MEGDGVQVFVESSWNVLQGSLDKCVTVVFLDPETQDPIISTSPGASEKLVLIPPAEPVPCEITVRFQGRLCHVQSFYTLSTARICELYSQSPKMDREYICTVKGWISFEDSCSSEAGAEVVSEAADGTHRTGMQETGFIEDGIDESVLSSVGSSSTVALNSAIDAKSIYSSSDDSWVDVKLHGSFTGENASMSLPAPECNTLHAEHELVNLEDQSILSSRPRSEEAKAEGAKVDGDSHLNECCGGEVKFEEPTRLQQDMFEAELELVDHSPWAAITIRLLSLQNKSLVEIDQMVFLAISGPVPEPASPCRSAIDQRANSLFAMFVPSMLQMARGVSGNSSSVLKCESSSLACEQTQDIIDRLPAEETSHSCEPPEEISPAGAEYIGVTSIQSAGIEERLVQQDSQDQAAAHLHTHEASKAGSLLYSGEGDREIPQFCDSNGAESKRAVEIEEQPFQLDSNAMPSCRCEKFAGDFSANDIVSALGAFSERFDRLESLCLRMESYMQKTFENLDQRIMHLEAQHRKGSEEAAACVTASSKESRIFVEAHNESQESGPSGVQCADMQYAAPSDLPSGAVCKEDVSVSSTQSSKQGYSEGQVCKEVPNLILFDVMNSDSSVVAEKLATEEATSENQESSRGPVAIRGSPFAQKKEPRAFLEEAWASALSAFASSFTPVVGAENAVENQVEDAHPSGSSHDVSISVSHECEMLGKENNSTNKATTHHDAELVAGLTNKVEDSNKEAVDGLIYEHCVEAPCDEPIMTAAHAFPIDVLQEKPDNFWPGFDFLGLRDTQSMPSKARAELNDFLEDLYLASTQGFSALGEDALATCPVFDIFATAHLKSAALSSIGLKSGLSPVLGSTSSKMHQDADFLSLGKEEALSSNNFSSGSCEDSRNFFHFDEKNKDFLYSFVDATSTEGSGEPSLFADAPKTEEIFCNTRDVYTADLLGNFLSREKGKALDMSEVQDPESFDSSVFTYCEAEGGGAATSFPDVLEEDCSNYQDGRACSSSEDSLCFSQDFDNCPNELCDDEWSCAPNVFYLNDPELTDDETNRAVADVEEKIEMSDLSDADSTEDALFWPAGQHYGRTNQQQEPTTVFPGFENLS